MSPWLFYIYIDGVVRVIDAKVFGRGGILANVNNREWNLNQLLPMLYLE